MPRIPTTEGSEALPNNPYGSTSPFLQQADQSGARAIQSVGQDLAQVGGAITARKNEADALALKAKQEASNALEMEGMAQADGRMMAATQKFKVERRGKEASAARADALAELEKIREETAEGIQDPSAKLRFRARSTELLHRYRSDIESHTGSEFEKYREETKKLRKGQALAAIEGGDADSEQTRKLYDSVAEDIRKNSRAEDGGAAEVADFRSEAQAKFIERLVAEGRNEEAEAITDAGKAILGSRYIATKTLVTKALAGSKQDAIVQDAMEVVAYAAKEARSAEGYLTEEALRAKVNFRDIPAIAQKEVEAEINRVAQHEAERLKADINAQREEMARADLDKRPIPTATRNFLYRHDPKSLKANEAEKAAKAKAWRIEQRGNARDKADARREQDRLDQEFLHDYGARLTEDPEYSLDQAKIDFIAKKAEEGDDIEVTSLALSVANENSVKAKKKLETTEGKAELLAEKTDRRALTKSLEDFYKPKKGQKLDQVQVNEMVGRAMKKRADKILENGGKPLTGDQLNQLKAELLTMEPVEVPNKYLPGTTTKLKPAIEQLPPTSAAPPPPAPRKLSAKEQQAIDWAHAHPEDPRAAAILKKVGVQ